MQFCCRVAVLVLCLILTVSGEFPGNTYLFSYTDRKQADKRTYRRMLRHADRRRPTDGKTDTQTDRHFSFYFLFFGVGGGCGYGIDGRKVHLGRQKSR